MMLMETNANGLYRENIVRKILDPTPGVGEFDKIDAIESVRGELQSINTYIGKFTITGTGTYNIVGCPFTPRYISLEARGELSSAYQSGGVTVSGATGTVSSLAGPIGAFRMARHYGSGASNRRGWYSFYSSNGYLLDLASNSGYDFQMLRFGGLTKSSGFSIDTNGFTLTIDTFAGGNIDVYYECFG